jgi:hypothetical protein
MATTYHEKRQEERVRQGKKAENRILRQLCEVHKQNAYATSEQMDMGDKIDCIWEINGRKLLSAIKTRTTGRDFGLCIYEPFYAWDHALNKMGRDLKGNYVFMLMESEDHTQFYVGNGKLLKHIACQVRDECKATGYTPVPKKPFRSSLYPGVEIRFKTDSCNGRPKLIVYIPPTVLGKYCKVFDFQEIPDVLVQNQVLPSVPGAGLEKYCS